MGWRGEIQKRFLELLLQIGVSLCHRLLDFIVHLMVLSIFVTADISTS